MVTLILIALFIFLIFQMHLQNSDKQERIAELNLQIMEMNDYINELNSDLRKPFDDAYIEEVATEKLGMRYPQEVIYYSGSIN